MKKKAFLSLIIIILLGIIGFELYYYVTNNNDEIKKVNNQKYLVDITKSYLENPLTYEVHNLNNNKNIYYISINGLKDKKIEEKINEEVNSKIEKLSKEVDLNKHTLFTSNYLGFENTLSIEFILIDEDIDNYEDALIYYDGLVLDTLNIDLNTGSSITIEDVINDIDKLKELVYKETEDNIYFTLGDTYNYCYDCNINKDYSKVEDSTLSVMNSFNKNDYLFSFRNATLNLYFNNVYVYNPLIIDDYDKECQNNKDCELIRGEYETYYLKEKYDKNYRLTLNYIDMVDNLIIYDKFKNNNNIFVNKSKEIERKFNEFDDYTYLSECEYDNCQYFKEIDNTIYDISITSYTDNAKEYTDNIVDNLKKNRKENSVYKVSCETYYLYPKEYYYFACNNYNYELSKSDYNKYRKDIYLNSYKRFDASEGAYSITDFDGYDFIDEKLSKNEFTYELISNNKEVKLQDILTDKIYDYIPYEYLKYDTKENLVKNMELYMDHDEYKKDTLGLHINMMNSKIYMQYNDNIYMLAEVKNDEEYDEFYDNSEIIIKDLFK